MNPQTTTVEYRDVPGFPGYRIGSDGSVWSRWKKIGLPKRGGSAAVLSDTWRELSSRPMSTRGGYVRCFLARDGRIHTKLAHRLVAEAFLGPPPAHMEVCHNDGNPANNRADNLRYDTRAANAADMSRHGRSQIGSKAKNHKITESDVSDILRRLSDGERGVTIARKYGVCIQTVSLIKHRKTWKHVTP